MTKNFFYKLFCWVNVISLVFQLVAPLLILAPINKVYAEDATPSAIVEQVSPTPTPTPTPTSELTATPSAVATDSAGQAIEATPSATPTPTIEVTPTETPTPSATPTPEVSPSVTPEPTPTIIVEPSPIPVPVVENAEVTMVVVPTLSTNKLDYAPTETAIISGKNFNPISTYTLEIKSDNPPPTNSIVLVTTDGSGNFSYSYQLDGNYRPNYKVEIKDSTGTVVATTTFTDAATASVSGNWSDTATWGGNPVPTSADAVTINSGVVVTVDVADAQAASINFALPAVNNGIAISGTNSLTVSGAITTTLPTTSSRNSTIAVGAGSLSVGSIALAGAGTASKATNLTISTGTVTVSGNITSAGIASVITFTGAGTLNAGGTFMSGNKGTFTEGTGTVNFNAAGAQAVAPFTYTFNNLTLSGSGTKNLTNTTVDGDLTLSGTATATTPAAMTIGGNLNIGSGTTFATGATNTWDLAVSGTTSVSGTLILANTDIKTFTGNVTINSGGTWNETAAGEIGFGGSLQNDGTFTASTGVHTFSGTNKTIGGANAIAIPKLTITGSGASTVTNNGVLTVSTTLAGSDTLANGTNAILNIGGTSSIALAKLINTGTLAVSGTGAITGITNNDGGIVNLSNSGTIASFNNATATSTLNISTTPTVPIITTLTVSAAGNTVNYNGAGAQTVKAVAYNKLILSGSGVKSLPTGTSTNGNLSIAPTGTATTSITNLVNIAVGTLTLGGLNRASGTWGYSGRTNNNTTYFANTTGYLTVATDTRAVMGGSIAITGTAKFDSTLTADPSSLTNAGNPTYQWKRGGVPIGSATASTYTLVLADIGTVITVTATADGTVGTDSITSAGTAVVAKADGPAAPSAPTLSSKTSTSITLTANASNEFSNDAGSNWQASNVFSGLTSSTGYTFVQRVAATVTTNESAASTGTAVTTDNIAPSFDAIADQNVNEDVSLQNIPITNISPGPSDESSQTVTLSATSSDTSLIPNPTFSGSGSTQTLAYAPLANANGTATITVIANDGQVSNNTFSRTFNITVNPINDPPTTSSVSNITINEDSSTGSIAITIGDIDNSVASLTMTGSSSDTSLVPNSNIVFGGSGANRTAVITPLANQNGTAVITFTVSDGSLTASTPFTLTVTAVNDSPVANNDSYGVNDNTTLSITAPGVLTNDTDIDSPTLTVALVADVSHGTLTLNTNGSFTYKSVTNYNGADVFTYRANDGSLNSNIATVTINVSDQTLPDTTINSGPLGLVNSNSATFTFSADETSTFQCQIDGGGYASCTSPKTYSGLGESSHTFDVKATDTAGNTDPTSASLTWTIDTIAPTITITNPGTSPALSKTVTAITSDGTLTMFVNGAGITTCNSSLSFVSYSSTTFSSEADNNKTICYRSVDSADNTAYLLSSAIAGIDKTAPDITVPTDITTEATSASGATVTYTPPTATDTVDGSDAVSCDKNSGETFSLGETIVHCSSTDTAGNTADKTFKVTVQDTTIPVISLNGTDPVTVQVYGIYTEDGAIVTDNYDTGLSATITGTVNVNTVGSYILHYNATDSHGNSAAEVTRTVNVVDTQIPVITLTGVNPQTIEIGSSYSELGAVVTDNYDTGLIASIDATGIDTAHVGSYTVKYTAVDSSGNHADEVDRTVNVVDTVSPSGGSINYTDGYYTTASVALTVNDGTDSAGSGINISSRTIQRWSATLSNGTCGSFGTWSAILPSGSYPDFTDPTVTSNNCYQYQYLVSDNASNQVTYGSINTVKVDTTFPTITSYTLDNTIISPNASAGVLDTATIDVAFSEYVNANISILDVSNTVVKSLYTSSGTVQNPTAKTWDGKNISGNYVSDGVYTIKITISDKADNTTVDTGKTITVDNTAPTGGLIDYTNGYYTAASVPLTVSDGTDSGSGVDTSSRIIQKRSAVLTNDTCGEFGSFAAISPSGSYPDFTDTTVVNGNCYQYQYLISDKTANQTIYTSENVTKIDTTAPTAPTATPVAGDYTSDQSVTLASSDSGSGLAAIYYTTDEATPSATSTKYTTPIIVDKDMTIKAIAYDNAGNVSSILSAAYGIAPKISSETSASVTSSSVIITWTTDDLATSRVVYDTVSHEPKGAAPDYGYANSTIEADNDPKVLSHSVGLTGLSSGTTYYYRTVSHGSPEAVSDEKTFITISTTSNDSGGGGTSAGASAPVCNDSKPGSAPTITSVVAGLNSVTLFWSKASDPVTYYLVTYGTSAGSQTYGNPNVGDSNTTSYTVSGLSGGATYYFKVRAGNGCKPGDFSNEISGTPTGGFISGSAVGFEQGVLGATENISTGGAATEAGVLGQSTPAAELVTKSGTSEGIPWWIFVGSGLAIVLAFLFMLKWKHESH